MQILKLTNDELQLSVNMKTVTVNTRGIQMTVDNKEILLSLSDAERIKEAYEMYYYEQDVLDYIQDTAGFFEKSLLQQYPDIMNDKEVISSVLNLYAINRDAAQNDNDATTGWRDCLDQAFRDILSCNKKYKDWRR